LNLMIYLIFLKKSNDLKLLNHSPFISLNNEHEIEIINKIDNKLLSRIEYISKNCVDKEHFLNKVKKMNENPINQQFLSEINKIVSDFTTLSALYNYFSVKPISIKMSKILTILRKYRLRLSLNKYKFEDKLLYKLNQYISKYYGKKVEFNIVNIKSIAYNADIFTQILTTKVRKERANPIFHMNALLGKVKFPRISTIVERSKRIKNVDNQFLGNKYKNLNISSIINTESYFKDNLNILLNKIYTDTSFNQENISSNENSYLRIRDIVLDNIKYKNLRGVKLAVKGRLTRRNRADRALYKLK
jgi:hypothetical protein